MSDEVIVIPGRSLVKKLCEVMAAVGYIQKRGENSASTQGYKYATEADVADAVRGEFAKRNLFAFPSLVNMERHKLSYIQYEKVKESYITDVVMRWTLVDGDTGEERIMDIPGSSASPGDKQVYVAMTGSEKYMLMKSLLIPTGDDPENNENEPLGSKEAQDAVAQRKIAGAGKTQTPINKPPVPPPAPARATPQQVDYDFVTLSGVLQGIEPREKNGKAFYKVFLTELTENGPRDYALTAFEDLKMGATSLFKELSLAEADVPMTFVCKEGKPYKGIAQFSIKGVSKIGQMVYPDTGQA